MIGLIRKSDYGPLNILFEIYDHVSKSDFGQLFNNSNFRFWKMNQNRIWTRDHKFRRENSVDQNRILEASTSRENELFWSKKGIPPYVMNGLV